MVLTATFMPSSSANSRARQIAGSSPASRRPPGSFHSLRSFSSSTTWPASSRTPLIETGKDIRHHRSGCRDFLAEHIKLCGRNRYRPIFPDLGAGERLGLVSWHTGVTLVEEE